MSRPANGIDSGKLRIVITHFEVVKIDACLYLQNGYHASRVTLVS